jgi:hypothetical protein
VFSCFPSNHPYVCLFYVNFTFLQLFLVPYSFPLNSVSLFHPSSHMSLFYISFYLLPTLSVVFSCFPSNHPYVCLFYVNFTFLQLFLVPYSFPLNSISLFHPSSHMSLFYISLHLFPTSSFLSSLILIPFSTSSISIFIFWSRIIRSHLSSLLLKIRELTSDHRLKTAFTNISGGESESASLRNVRHFHLKINI